MIYTGWLNKRLVIDWEPHRLVEIYENVVSITSKSNKITYVYLREKKHRKVSLDWMVLKMSRENVPNLASHYSQT